MSTKKPVKRILKPKATAKFELPLTQSKLCPIELLELDFDNPRLQTGSELPSATERDVIEALAEIAALDELVTSICTNGYKNLEPMIVVGDKATGPFKVLEGNRRLASIKLIQDPELAADLDIKVPAVVPPSVVASFQEVLVYRVQSADDARDFIGFKHINGPQRWDAYAKARYVADWYRREYPRTTIDEIAAKIGDTNSTLRSYIYAILALDQAADEDVWTLGDRPKTRGRFGFSHLYTALQRDEFQQVLGMKGGWTSKPKLKPIAQSHLPDLAEVLTYLYGSISQGRQSLIHSQNPDLKDIGLAMVDEKARLVLRNRGDLDDARDALKTPSEAFQDAVTTANLRLKRAIELVPKYTKKSKVVEAIVAEIIDQAEILGILVERVHSGKAGRGA